LNESPGSDGVARRPQYTVLQLSDCHVPADGWAFGRVDACARIEAAFELPAAAGWPVDLVILSGDPADRGEETARAG